MNFATVAFVRDRSLVGDVIGYFGGGFWDHGTSFVSETLVIDSRSDAIAVPWAAAAPDKHWKKIGGGWWHIPAGVQVRPASYLRENPYLLKIALPCTAQQHAHWLKLLEGQLGKPYDKLGILDFATGALRDPNWRGKRAWFCDALQLWALEASRIIQPIVGLIDRLTPGAACNICCASEGAKIAGYRGELVGEFIKAAGLQLPQAA